MFNPIKLVTFIYQAGFQGQGVPTSLRYVGKTIKNCADLYFKIRKL
jgi:hypothetical protein